MRPSPVRCSPGWGEGMNQLPWGAHVISSINDTQRPNWPTLKHTLSLGTDGRSVNRYRGWIFLRALATAATKGSKDPPYCISLFSAVTDAMLRSSSQVSIG